MVTRAVIGLCGVPLLVTAVIAGEWLLGVIGAFLIVSSLVSMFLWRALEKKADASALDTPIPQNQRPTLLVIEKPDSRVSSID